MPDPLRRVLAHEALFVDRYDALLRAALKVTEGDRQAAEDLVQDAFVRFTLVQPPLDEVERLDAYFYAMLRNMYTSRMRRRGRTSELSLSILDFDSLDAGLETTDVLRRFEARQTVLAVCQYGCLRRHSTKAGSIFLLRFFHGYLPSEIARIARLSPAIVDELLFRARREARLFIERPGQLAFLGTGQPRALPVARPDEGRHDEDECSGETLVRQVRAMMFSDRHAPCWSRRALRDLYRADRTDPVAREHLAALVGCPVCLDEVNTLLNIPGLATRWPTDTLGPGARGGGGSRRSPHGLAAARRRASAVFEHRPRELRVLVNGFELGSQTLGADPREFMLSANIGEPVALVELFSERNVCLLFLDVCPPPDGPVRQRRRVELSEGRHAELELTFNGPWPTVRASYVDPRGVSVVLADPELNDESVAPAPPAEPAAGQAQPVEAPNVPWRWRLFGLRPAPAMIVVLALVVWLLFWTPGVEVSAAERIVQTIRSFVAELFSSRKTSVAPGPVVVPSSRPARPSTPAAAVRPTPAPSATRLTVARRTTLELRAIAQLQRVDAYLGQEVSFGPADAAHVEMRAMVDGEARQHTLEQALASLVRTREVRADIADLRQAARQVHPVDVVGDHAPREFVFVKDQFPMFGPLRQYFKYQHEYRSQAGDTAAFDDGQLDAEVRRFASRVFEHARRASHHAWALRHLADRFSPTMIGASVETQELWQSVVREHGRGYRQETALLRSALEPIVKASGLVDVDTPQPLLPPPAETPRAWSRITRLLDVQVVLDGAIKSGFAVQSEGTGVALVQTQAFWRLLDEADRLAAEVADPSGRDQ